MAAQAGLSVVTRLNCISVFFLFCPSAGNVLASRLCCLILDAGLGVGCVPFPFGVDS